MLQGGADSSIATREHDLDNAVHVDCHQLRYLPTGLTSLDQILKGGIRVGSISEFVGCSGVGKTQLALQLCIMAARYSQGAIYVDTEKKLRLPRLREMSANWKRHQEEGATSVVSIDRRSLEKDDGMIDFSYSQQFGGSNVTPDGQGFQGTSGSQSDGNNGANNDVVGFKSPERVLGNLTVHQPGSTEELLEALDALEDEILHRNQLAIQAVSAGRNHNSAGTIFPVRLLIVDSIAAPIRRDFGSDSAPQRSMAIFQCAQTLKRLADQLHLAVVVINQIGSVDANSAANSSIGRSDATGHPVVQAALGTSWHHCVSTRLMLEMLDVPSPRRGTRHNTDENLRSWGTRVAGSQETMRRVSIVKSNVAAFAETEFEVTSVGTVEAKNPLEPSGTI